MILCDPRYLGDPPVSIPLRQFHRWISLAFGLGMILASARAQISPLETANLGRCALDSGKSIDPCWLTYRTFGHLDPDRGNAVLFPSWYNGTSEDLIQFFGPNKLVDTSRYFGIAVDALADGVSSSPSNSTTQHGAEFPAITIRDMVRAEYRLATEILHLHHLHAVVGISMGGFQTFEWIVDYPTFIDKAVPIVGSPRQSSYDLLHWDLMKRLIESDPGFDGGNYTVEPVLALANEFNALSVRTPAYTARTVSRQDFPKLLAESLTPTGAHDANDRLIQLGAVIAQDVTRGSGSLAETARTTQVSQLVVVATYDHLVNPAPALEWAHAIHAQTFVSIGDCGHLSVFECDGPAITATVRDFLAAK